MHVVIFSDILTALDTGEENDLFTAGASCFCPIDCEENVYIPEMSQAKIRSDSYVLKVGKCVTKVKAVAVKQQQQKQQQQYYQQQ